MNERLGVAIAIVSTSIGGSAAAITRYLVGAADPITLAILRWDIGVLIVLPVAIALRVRWPAGRDFLAIVVLGVFFFALFFILYNIAMGFTTAARASLALSTLPLQTMLAGTALRVEMLTWRKTIGVGVAMVGVFGALASDVSSAPPGAWRGEAIMTGAVFCMALYNVFSRPFIQRSSALGFLAVGMGAGAVTLLVAGGLSGSFEVLRGFSSAEWIAGAYLGVAGGALAFILWVVALQHASPTRVANTMTVSPIAAAGLAAFLIGEPITLNLVAGLIAVFAGIWLSTTDATRPAADQYS
jgi:drug/metabolite transporter (DMT)-like permease